MLRIHVLTPGFETPNGRAFLFPLVVWRRSLRDAGIDCRLFRTESEGLTDCDVVVVDSKFHRDLWQTDETATLAKFAAMADRCRVIYCDTSDLSGWVNAKVLPLVHVYAKGQLLRERAGYAAAMYARRPYSDYYHRRLGVEDATPEWSRPITDAAQLNKLRLSWHSGLANYSLYGPARMALYGHMPMPWLLQFPRRFVAPREARSQDISCRFGFGYPRASVAAQRRLIHERMRGRIDTRKVSRRGYFRELERSKVIVSPFGYGEITLKDFEVMLTGGLLFKPDMTHMVTWPDLFRDGETMLTHAWDLSDFDDRLRDATENYQTWRHVAETAQEMYRRHMIGAMAETLFADHFRALIAAAA